MLKFWRFVAGRHRIFLRRVVWRTPPPWTDDLILASVRFTNVYRELDRGTRFLIRHILPFAASSPPERVIFNVIVYRMFGVPDTWLALGGFDGVAAWDRAQMLTTLADRQRRGERLYTSAYRSSQRGLPCGPGEKYQVTVEKLTQIWQRLAPFTASLLKAPSMQAAHALLAQLPGLGGETGFMAYEVLSDLILDPAVLSFSEDEWVNVGPGARAALGHLIGTRPISDRMYEEAVHELRWNQEVWLKKANAALHGPVLTLRNVEHSLCELSKYMRAKADGHAKRRFRPEAASQDFSLWDDIPSAFVVPRRVPLAPMTAS